MEGSVRGGGDVPSQAIPRPGDAIAMRCTYMCMHLDKRSEPGYPSFFLFGRRSQPVRDGCYKEDAATATYQSNSGIEASRSRGGLTAVPLCTVRR